MKFKASKIFFSNPIIVVFAILALAAFLRLYRIADYMTFLGDEGRDVLVVYNILHGHLTLLGPTASVGGFFLGPIYYYFMAPFLLLFNYNPVGPAVMVALFGIATVLLVYKIGSEFFGRKEALLAALFYSISPLVISYSRSSWNPNLMPFFSLLTLYILYKAVFKQNWLLFIACGLFLGITMQLHYLATFLGVIILFYIFLANKFNRVSKEMFKLLKDYLLVFLGFIIGWSPFIAFETRHGFRNIQSITGFVFHPLGKDAIVESHGFFSTIFNVFFRLFGRLVANFPPPEQIDLRPKILIFFWQIGILAIALISTFILLKITYKAFKEKKDVFLKYLLLSVWLILGILLFGFYRKQIYDYYLGFLFPLPFLLVSNALVVIGRKKKYLYVSLIAFLVLLALNLDGIPFRFESNRQLAQVETISKFVVDKAENKPFNFALVAAGNSDFAYRYFFKIWASPVVEIKNPIEDPQRKSVTDQLLVVCETLPCHPLGWASWEVAGFGRAEIEKEWTVSVVQVDKLRHYRGK